MDRTHDAVINDDNSELVSSCLDMIWDDEITDTQLATLIETVKNPKISKKLSRYQYNQDIMKYRISTKYINIVQSVNKKITDAENKEKLKEERKFIKYQHLIEDRSFFWPFSLPALALCSVFFIALSVSNNSYKNTPSQILVTKDNYSNEYLFNDNKYSSKYTNYIRVSTLEDISINFNANELYNINLNNHMK